MLPEPIPASFVLEKTTLSLPELRWAFERGIIGAGFVVKAAGAIPADESADSLATRLATLARAELSSVNELLASIEYAGDEEQEHHRKWTWLVLSWVYERGHSRPDIFDQIESLYADLGYPEEMVPFGPYAPVYEAKSDPAEVRQRVLGEWRRYLESVKATFGREN